MLLNLTQGKKAVVDDGDAHLCKWKWCYSSGGYAKRGVVLKGRHRTVYLHHAVAGFPLLGKEVDHRNGNRLDCRKENLRIVTKRENKSNMDWHRGEKLKLSRFVGVYPTHNKTDKWMSRIFVKGKREYLGTFNTQEEASIAYKKRLADLIKTPYV